MVSRVIAYDVVALPFARRPVAGVGVYETGLVVSLELSEREPSSARRSVTGALLAPARPRCRFALEIDRVIGAVHVARVGGRSGKWIADAETIDGRSLPWLLVDELLAELGVGAAA